MRDADRLTDVSEPERTLPQVSTQDLRAQIEAGARQRRRGRHHVPSGPRHRASIGPRPRRRWPAPVRLAALLLSTVVLVIAMRSFVVASFYIPSASMEQTLHGCDGCEPDRVMVDKLSYRFVSPSRRDVVVFDRPPEVQVADKELIKRIIGLPGDSVAARGRTVYVNGKALSEPYVDSACRGTDDFGPITVPAGRYFMMGDNRCNSEDSRIFGTIARSAFVGRAFAVVWPAKHLRWL